MVSINGNPPLSVTSKRVAGIGLYLLAQTVNMGLKRVGRYVIAPIHAAARRARQHHRSNGAGTSRIFVSFLGQAEDFLVVFGQEASFAGWNVYGPRV
jgi:hypothetical protein